MPNLNATNPTPLNVALAAPVTPTPAPVPPAPPTLQAAPPAQAVSGHVPAPVTLPHHKFMVAPPTLATGHTPVSTSSVPATAALQPAK